jgi:hypothetical protein
MIRVGAENHPVLLESSLAFHDMSAQEYENLIGLLAPITGEAKEEERAIFPWAESVEQYSEAM